MRKAEVTTPCFSLGRSTEAGGGGGAAFINGLANKHSRLTRLTTRMSAEDMTYDPVFVTDTHPPPNTLSGPAIGAQELAGLQS